METEFGTLLPQTLLVLWRLVILKSVDPESRPVPDHTPCSLLRELRLHVSPLLGPPWQPQSLRPHRVTPLPFCPSLVLGRPPGI